MKSILVIALGLSISLPSIAAPNRLAKMTVKMNRQLIDLSGPEPVMRLEEICRGELDIPVIDYVNAPTGPALEIEEIRCSTSYQQIPGRLSAGASVLLRNDPEKGVVKFLSAWIYFTPDNFENPDSGDLVTLPNHAAAVSTKDLGLEHIQFSLWAGGPEVCAYRGGDQPVCMLGNTFLVSIEIHDPSATATEGLMLFAPGEVEMR